MINPKITVIVPTRERSDVLEKCLRTLVSQCYGNLEIIVSDNCSNDDTREVVRRANDARIRYLNTESRLNMTHNWEFALSHVKEGWVTFVGDDDGLLPRAISRVAEIIDETGSLAIRSRMCTFEWPTLIGAAHGYLLTPMGTGMEQRDASAWLDRVMRGYAKYAELPMIYNGGFIHISVLDRIREITGAYFLSPTPDVYSAIAIAGVVDSYVYSRAPLAISGTSRHSTGNSFFSKNRGRDPHPSEKFISESNIPFHAEMPLCPDGSYPLSLHALVYEAYLQARKLHRGRKIDHMQQLQIIMGSAGVHTQSVRQWGRLFANLHGLDYERALRGARIRGLTLKPLALAKKVANAANCISAGSVQAPLQDIHEASIVAAVIRDSRGRVGTLFDILKKQRQKLAQEAPIER
jgi:hypothetical protein